METRKYELSLWLSPSFNDAEAEEAFNGIVKKIESSGGQIISTQPPQLKLLNYKIKKETDGYFGFINFSGGEIKLDNLEKELHLNDKILRFIIVRIPESKQKLKKLRYPVFAKTRSFARREKPGAPATQAEPALPKREELSLEELDKKLNEILKE